MDAGRSRKRKANFTTNELEAMVVNVNEHIGNIQNHNQGESFRAARNDAWNNVLRAINLNSGGEPRTLTEVQKSTQT